MTLENKVLERLAEPGSDRRQELQVSHPESGWNLYITAERRDDLGCLVWEMTLRREPAPGLEAWADKVVERTLSLVERVKVYEIDMTRNEGLLRTTPVRRRGHNLYFEVRLHGSGSLTLRRFQAPRAKGRAPRASRVSP